MSKLYQVFAKVSPPVCLQLILYLLILTACPSPEPETNLPVVSPVLKQKLNTPTALCASQAAYTGVVVVTWDAVADAVAYRIIRAISLEGIYTEIGASITAEYSDTGVEPELHYFYKVQALAGKSQTSDFSFVAEGWAADPARESRQIEIEVTVLDSIGGTLLDAVEVSLYNNAEDVLVDSWITDSQGCVHITLDSLVSYNITAVKEGRAASLLQNFEADDNCTSLVLYCHEQRMVSFPAEPPEIVSVAYSADNVTYQPLLAGSTVQSGDWHYLAIAVRGASAIIDDKSPGFGIGLNIDDPLKLDDYIRPESYGEYAEPADGGFLTRGIFNLSSFDFGSGEVALNIFAYDMAGNRVAEKVTVNLSGLNPGNDMDISRISPQLIFFWAKTYGNSLNNYGNTRSLLPYDDANVSYCVSFKFEVVDVHAEPVDIRKIRVFRSEDNLNYSQVSKINSGELLKESYYYYDDYDPALLPGVTYFYKFVAENNSSVTVASNAVSFKLLPPYHLNLSAPANCTVSTSLSPEFIFSASRLDMFDSSMIDRLTFTFDVDEMTGEHVFHETYFIEGTAKVPFYGNYDRVDYISMTDTDIIIDSAAAGIVFESGKTYQWNIRYGDQGVLLNKYYWIGSHIVGEALSFNTTGFYGRDASNGWFILTMSPHAR